MDSRSWATERLSATFAETLFREHSLASSQLFEDQSRDLFLTDPSQSQLWFSLLPHSKPPESRASVGSEEVRSQDEMRQDIPAKDTTPTCPNGKKECVSPMISAKRVEGIGDLRNIIKVCGKIMSHVLMQSLIYIRC